TVAHARGDEALQRILRRGAQPALARAGIDVAAEPGAETLDVRFGIAGRREDRRLHFQHLAFSEERADQGVEVGAQMQGGESLSLSPYKVGGEGTIGVQCAFTPSPPAMPGERAGVRGALFVHGLHDRFEYIVSTQQGIVVPEAQHAETGSFEVARTLPVVSTLLCVLTTVQFHDELAFHATEIGVIAGDRMLSTELHAELVGAQARPEPLLGIGHVAAQFAGALHGQDAPCRKLPLTPTLSPNEVGGEGVFAFQALPWVQGTLHFIPHAPPAAPAAAPRPIPARLTRSPCRAWSRLPRRPPRSWSSSTRCRRLSRPAPRAFPSPRRGSGWAACRSAPQSGLPAAGWPSAPPAE